MSQGAAYEALVADEDLDVARVVAELARDVYPEVVADALVAQIRALAEPARRFSLDRHDSWEASRGIAKLLYEDLGFHGDPPDHHDPRNSLLPDVLERRTGLPIALALVYLEVAKALGVRASGIGFPGHFLIRVESPYVRTKIPLVIDPNDGEAFDEGSLREMYREATETTGAIDLPAVLAPIRPRAMVLRWLTNLRAAYLRRGENARALVVIDRIVALTPKDAAPLRDRGLLAWKLGAPVAARADLERVVTLDPDGNLGREARTLLAQIDKTRVAVS